MLLHLGRDVSVFTNDVVMIMDAQSVLGAAATQGFLARVQRQSHTVQLCAQAPKSYVLVRRKGEEERLYGSPISAATLLKRCEQTQIEAGRNGYERVDNR